MFEKYTTAADTYNAKVDKASLGKRKKAIAASFKKVNIVCGR